eukprot:11185269-Lingulodinium_polyedra.AAC.1
MQCNWSAAGSGACSGMSRATLACLQRAESQGTVQVARGCCSLGGAGQQDPEPFPVQALQAVL